MNASNVSNGTGAGAAARPRTPWMRPLVTMIVSETKMVARDTAGLIVPLGLPLLILLTSAGSAGDIEVGAGRTALDVFVLPIVIVIVIAMIGIVNVPSFLAYYRRSGILRRFAVTPASPSMVLIAQAVVGIAQAVAGITIGLTIAALAFGANPPVDVAAALGVGALTLAAMFAAGMIVASVAPTPNSAVAIGLVAFLGLGALGGMFGGAQSLPEPVAAVGAVLPFGAAVEGLGAAWVGAPVDPLQWGSLATTVIVGLVVSALLFRWE